MTVPATYGTMARMRRWAAVAALATLALPGCSRLVHTRTYDIRSASMEPSLRKGDRVSCSNRVPATLHRGQVVAFHDPNSASPKLTFVKRVIGVGGDTLTTTDGNHFSLNGVPLDEPYVEVLSEGAYFPPAQPPVTVPAGRYFVMGDNRVASSDSRFNGTVPRADVVAVCTRVVSPRSHRGRIAGT